MIDVKAMPPGEIGAYPYVVVAGRSCAWPYARSGGIGKDRLLAFLELVRHITLLQVDPNGANAQLQCMSGGALFGRISTCQENKTHSLDKTKGGSSLQRSEYRSAPRWLGTRTAEPGYRRSELQRLTFLL